MSDENKGSDLDIFEGLGKKSAAPVSAVPPPPPSGGHRASIPAPAPELKKTLLGIPGPAAMTGSVPAPAPSRPPPLPPGHAAPSAPPMAAASPSAAPPARPSAPPMPAARPSAPPITQTLSSASAPPPPAPSRVPPPPSRSSLPAVVPPPSQSSMPATARAPSNRPSQAVPPAPVTQPTGSNGRKIQMDWDDDQEATHVFDKETKSSASGEVTTVAAIPAEVANAGRPSQAPVLNVPAAPSNAPPPAPSSLSGAFAQLGTSGTPSAPPPPPSMRTSGAPPPPPGTMRASAAPPPPPPGQTTTAPMHMPPRVSAPPPPPHQPASVPPVSAGPVSAPPVSAPPPSLQMPPISRSMEETAMVPRQQSKTGLWVGLGAAALAVAGAFAFFAMPRSATLAVNVADATGKEVSKLEVLVDDQKRCDSAPCIVPNLSSGVHSVKVKADGYEALAPRAVSMSGKDDTVSFTLAKAGPAAGTGLKVSGLQPGVRLFVDGKDIGALPQDLKDLAPGEHTVKIAGSERYEPLEKTVTVRNGEMNDLGNVALKVLKGKVTFEAGTPGAKAHLESGGNKRALPYLPIAIDFDPKEKWELVATAAGFDELRRPIAFDDGQAEKTIPVTLSPKGSAPAVVQPVALAQPVTPATPKPVTAPATTPATAAATTPKPAPAAAAGEAFLNINSLPASTVVLDGKPLGATPKLKVPVSAGSHTVLFVNAEQSLKKSVTVSVGAGETKPVIGKLRE